MKRVVNIVSGAPVDKKAVIIGGGPAGLTTAYELQKAGVNSVVLEKDEVVGGISRTVDYNGYLFDIGGHRFFTKAKAVEDLWHEILDNDDFLYRRRLSRIYYNKKFFNYPLNARNALFGLGVWNSILIFGSYVYAQIRPTLPEKTFEQWVSNRFGKRLYETFFKTYTEKVWGMSCKEISADWAGQRIKGLSLISAIKHALIKQGSSGNKGKVVTTLIDAFHYPRRGPGMMWEKVAAQIQLRGSELHLKSLVTKINWDADRVRSVEYERGGERCIVTGSDFVSSMPIRELIQRLSPDAPQSVREAADSLKYRDFLTVALIINKKEVFPDNWIYIHDPDVSVGRIQNFKNWSPEMVPDLNKTCLGLEYFCFEGDDLWEKPDCLLIEQGIRELAALGLVDGQSVEEGMVVRMPKAYPVYDGTYQQALDKIRGFLTRFSNLQVVGRNGMHKYNNQDHSMLTAMYAAKNVLGAQHDLWGVNTDSAYHEEVMEEEAGAFAAVEATQPQVPRRVNE